MKLESAEFIFVKRPRARFRPVGAREIEVGLDTFLSDEKLQQAARNSIKQKDIAAEAKRIIEKKKADIAKNPMLDSTRKNALSLQLSTKEALREQEQDAERRLYSKRLTASAERELKGLMGKAQKFCEGLEV